MISACEPLEFLSVAIEDIKNLPTTACVYLIRNGNGDILYVGKSENLNRRWKNHHKFASLIGEPSISISYLEVPQEKLYAAEKALVSAFCPPLNEEKPVKGIAALRQNAGLTQLELAQLVGVTESTISNWEKGRNGLEWFERVAKLCKALNCSPDELIDYIEAVEDGSND